MSVGKESIRLPPSWDVGLNLERRNLFAFVAYVEVVQHSSNGASAATLDEPCEGPSALA